MSENRKLYKKSDEEYGNSLNAIASLPKPVAPYDVKDKFRILVKIFRCNEMEGNPIVLITIQNIGPWATMIMGGGYSGHLMNPSAEVLEGFMYWNHMVMENYGNFSELCSQALISDYPRTFIPLFSERNTIYSEKSTDVSSISNNPIYGYAVPLPSQESSRQLQDIIDYLKSHIDGTQIHGNPDTATITYCNYSLTASELPYINIWINRNEFIST